MQPVPPILNAYSPPIVYVPALGQSSSSDSYQLLSIILALVLLLWPDTARTCALVLAAAVALPSLIYLFQVILVPFFAVVILMSVLYACLTCSSEIDTLLAAGHPRSFFGDPWSYRISASVLCCPSALDPGRTCHVRAQDR